VNRRSKTTRRSPECLRQVLNADRSERLPVVPGLAARRFPSAARISEAGWNCLVTIVVLNAYSIEKSVKPGWLYLACRQGGQAFRARFATGNNRSSVARRIEHRLNGNSGENQLLRGGLAASVRAALLVLSIIVRKFKRGIGRARRNCPAHGPANRSQLEGTTARTESKWRITVANTNTLVAQNAHLPR